MRLSKESHMTGIRSKELEKPPSDQGLLSIDQVHTDISKRLDEQAKAIALANVQAE